MQAGPAALQPAPPLGRCLALQLLWSQKDWDQYCWDLVGGGCGITSGLGN